MVKQGDEFSKTFSKPENEITCGDVGIRFRPTPQKALEPLYTKVENQLDVIVPPLPIVKLTPTMQTLSSRQILANDLYSLDNLFLIEFKGLDENGCKIQVKYLGTHYYDKVTTENIRKRRLDIYIREQTIDTNKKYDLTITRVNSGGIIVDKSDKSGFSLLPINLQISKNGIIYQAGDTTSASNLSFNAAEKTQLSFNFNQAIAYLLGFDTLDKNLSRYDILFNIITLYSNLLMRELYATYLLFDTAFRDTNFKLFNLTKQLLEPMESVYGGKNNRKKHKSNKHNNPKK